MLLYDCVDNYWLKWLLWCLFTWTCVCISVLIVHFIAPNAVGSGVPDMRSILSGITLKRYTQFTL